ncbi:LEA type 2 family protein [Paraburkholderia sp.]|uniref:LEA type 2 family protein n=1 Tax=Paraburkholderia sp. TaxID=1926495 RepID=UPI0039E5EC4B
MSSLMSSVVASLVSCFRTPSFARRSTLPRLFLLAVCTVCAALTLDGCAGLLGGDSLRVSVAGIEPLRSEGLEMRFNLKLRVQNPNDTAVSFNGISLDLELNGKPFASGVSDQSGSVPRFGETIIAVPLTVPAFSAVRQALALAGATQSGQIPYILRGKLAGTGLTGSTRFIDQGTLSLPVPGIASR